MPVKNVCKTPLVGGQWTKGDKGYDLVITANPQAAEHSGGRQGARAGLKHRHPSFSLPLAGRDPGVRRVANLNLRSPLSRRPQPGTSLQAGGGSEDMPLLQLEQLSKRYGALVVTDAVSLAVQKGEIVGILGPNGAGKTTLFNLVAGTVKPDKGLVLFKGDDISDHGCSSPLQAWHLAFVPGAAPFQWHDGV